MKLTSIERRWAQAILEAFAPASTPEGLAPREGEVDYLHAMITMANASTPRARLGLRFAFVMLALAPLWTFTAFATMAGLPVERRTALLARLLDSSIFLVRELTLLIKLQAAFALLATPSIRARSGYDGAPDHAASHAHPHPHPHPHSNATDAQPREPRKLLPTFRPSRSGAA